MKVSPGNRDEQLAGLSKYFDIEPLENGKRKIWCTVCNKGWAMLEDFNVGDVLHLLNHSRSHIKQP